MMIFSNNEKAYIWCMVMLEPTIGTTSRYTVSEVNERMKLDNGVVIDDMVLEDKMKLNRLTKNDDRYGFRDDSLPFFKINRGNQFDNIDRAALVSSLLLACSAKGQLDTRKAKDYQIGSDRLCAAIFGKGPDFFGKRLRDTVIWVMDAYMMNQTDAISAVLDACGLKEA